MPDSPDTPDLELQHPEGEAPDDLGTKFVAWLAAHREGVLDVDLRDAFTEVVNAVTATGKAGKVTLTLTVEPTKGSEMLAISDKIDAKVPVEAVAKLYYRDLDGSLTRDNPLQPKLLIPFSDSEKD